MVGAGFLRLARYVAVALALSCSAALAQSVPCSDGTTVPVVRRGPTLFFENQFCSRTYGFKVKLPKDVVATAPAPPVANHGFHVELARGGANWATSPPRILVVDVSDDLTGDPLGDTAEEHVSETRARLKNDASTLKVQESETTLGGQPALRIDMTYRERNADRHEVYIATGRDDIGALYTVQLTTSVADYDKDAKLLDAVVKGFEFTAKPE